MKETLILLLVLLLGAVIRIYDLSSLPPSLNWDEVSHGYNAYSILQTGKDEWGQSLPLTNFRAYGDYPLPLYMYLAMPGIAIFGLNEFSIRLPSALAGSFLILIGYFLSKGIIKGSNKLVVVTALLIAISPWGIMLSRQVLQATPAILFLSLGILLFISGVYKRNWLTILGVFFIGLSAYGYHNTRIIAPLLLLTLFYLYKDLLFKQKKMLLGAIIIGAIFLAPLPFIISSQAGSARSNWVGIVDQGAINSINEKRGNSTLPDPLPRLLYNKPLYFSQTAVRQYLEYFSPKYLFINGGTHYQFSIPGFGVLHAIELPFFYIGLFYLLLKVKRLSPEFRLLLIWLLLAPMPAAITRDSYQVVRSTTMLPAIYILITLGMKFSYDFISDHLKYQFRRYIITVFFGLLFLSAGRFLYTYWYIYPIEYSSSWQYGYKQAVSYIKDNQNKYPQILITKKYGEPHEFLLFFMKYNPARYRNDSNLVRYFRSDWYWVDSFDKYRFLNDWEVLDKTKDQKGLLITSPGNYPQNGHLLKTIYFLNGESAFDIVEL